MTPFLQLILLLSIIIFSAKLAGYLSTRLGQPSVFGELLIGLALGPSLIDLAHLSFITNSHMEDFIIELGEIGVLLLMFLAGIELHISDLAKNTKVSALAGSFGVIFPVGLGYLTGYLFGLETKHALFLGLALGATSVSISAQTLMELHKLRSKVGLGLLGAAVFDDIIVILLLSTVTALLSSGGASAWEIVLVFLRMVLYLALSAGFGIWLLPRIVRLTSRLSISQGLVAIALVLMFLFGLTAELIGGMAAITGTFIAGLMFARTEEKGKIETGFSSIAYGFFVPIFFVAIGLRVNIRDLQLENLWFLLVISVVAIIGKVLGSGLGARIGGYKVIEALQLGIGMVSRGEVGLIVASVGLASGLVDQTVFSSLVGMVLLTTLVTPPMLRASFAKETNVKTDETTQPAKIEQKLERE